MSGCADRIVTVELHELTTTTLQRTIVTYPATFVGHILRHSYTVGHGQRNGRTMTVVIGNQAHRQAMTAPIQEIAGRLQELLSRRLTAYIAGVDNGRTVARWASGEITEIRQHGTEQRLRAAYEIALLLLDQDA